MDTSHALPKMGLLIIKRYERAVLSCSPKPPVFARLGDLYLDLDVRDRLETLRARGTLLGDDLYSKLVLTAGCVPFLACIVGARDRCTDAYCARIWSRMLKCRENGVDLDAIYERGCRRWLGRTESLAGINGRAIATVHMILLTMHATANQTPFFRLARAISKKRVPASVVPIYLFYIQVLEDLKGDDTLTVRIV